jgi:ATP-dependent helicase/nuclease subunit A
MVIYDLRFTIYDCNSISAHEMEPSPQTKNSLTKAQQQAVAARGNVLVMAGAGTGKTHTLVERCLDCIGNECASLDEILVVTFTEAAAAEMKQRLRRVLEEKSRENPNDFFFAEQLALFDAAHIGTLHGFCFKLVRERFYELGLDPQPTVLDEGEARLLADETLEEVLQEQYEGRDELARSVQGLIQTYGGARDEKIRPLVLRLHHYAQTRPDAEGWLARQIEQFSAKEPADWQKWLLTAIQDWRDEWLLALENLGAPISRSASNLSRNERAERTFGVLSNNEKAVELVGMLQGLKRNFSREAATTVLEQIVAADGNWPAKRKGILRKPLEDLFDEAQFLASVARVKNGSDPLAEDWNWVRGHMTALLRLEQNFAARFAARKRDDGVLDFHDLEQSALKLLWDFTAEKPTPTAQHWREKIRFVFVDEYQDINAAQDKIIQALSSGTGVSPVGSRIPTNRQDACATTGNRFLVGDVKQSIYRFRLADPKIFRDYAKSWRGKDGQTISLADNFRSRESLLNFVNSIFSLVMREEIGGVNYDDEAKLKFGSPETRAELSAAQNQSPRAELLLRLKTKPGEVSGKEDGDLADLEESAKEARLVAQRLGELKNFGHEIWDDKQRVFRAVEWRDIAVLLRAPTGKAEIFAKEFERAGVPLVVARGGFYDTSEVLDLLSLLQLLDNPLQDVPCIAVLRSPLVGLSLDELAEIRLAVKEVHFWTALNRARNAECGVRNELRRKIEGFLERFSRWRKLARQVSLSQCLEEVLAETHYADWLQSRPRGAQRRANVEQFLNLAQRFDQFQRQGLFRFLKFIEAQREAGAEPEVAPVADENAVRLMSIHQSKGLEFPVVVVADLSKTFNEQDLRSEIILDGEFGLCPRVQPPQTGARYPSLPHWLAQRRQRCELRGEELRLLYVATTRARDTLILTASVTDKNWDEKWTQPQPVTTQQIVCAKSFADWLAIWFANQVQSPSAFAKLRRDEKSKVQSETEGELPHLRWRLVADAELGCDSARSSRGDKAQTETISEPPHVGCHEDYGVAEKLRARLGWNYPFKVATRRKAKSSVTELRRAAEELDEEAEPVFSFQFSAKRLAGTLAPPGRNPHSSLRAPHLSAVETGTAHHKFLQHVSLEKTGDRAAIETETRRLEQVKILSAEECAVLDLDALVDFWNSPPGRKIRAQRPDSVKRELPFTAKFSPEELDALVGSSRCDDRTPQRGVPTSNEFVVVQGVADLVVLLPKEIWLVDFKTDQIRADELPAKAKLYTPQLKLYASALVKIYLRPVANCWLHSLDARKTVEVKI